MAKSNYCSDCDVRFKVRHDVDEFLIVMFCPFCGTELVLEENDDSFHNDDEEDE